MGKANLNPDRATGTGNMADVLHVAIPLILASSGHAIRMFCDRFMLAQYSSDAIKASLQAGVTSYTVFCLFHGVLFYTSAFVSQYSGSGQKRRIGEAVWTAILAGAVVGAILPGMQFFSPALFHFMGGSEEVIRDEIAYFNILNGFCIIPLISAPLHSFWSGRGRTYVVMSVELSVAALNVFLNWVLIYGNLGAPRLGIFGAGLGTVLSAGVGLAIYFLMFLLPSHCRTFGTWPRRLFNVGLFKRLIRFGGPSGIQLFLDLITFNIFVALLGNLGEIQREANNIAFSLNLIAFFPMVGIGSAAGILVGQSVGAQDISRAHRAVRNAVLLSLTYAAVVGFVFIFTPEVLLQFFVREGDPAQLASLAITRNLLWFLAGYIVFEGLLCVFRGAINGAGDTNWTMRVTVLLGWTCFVFPEVLSYVLGGGIYELWLIFVSYVVLVMAVLWARYRGGKWTKMRVIEAPPTFEGDAMRAVDQEEPGV